MVANSVYLYQTIKAIKIQDSHVAVKNLSKNFEDEYFRLNKLMTLCKEDSDFILSLSGVAPEATFIESTNTAKEKMSIIKSSLPYADNVYAYIKSMDAVLTHKSGIINVNHFLENMIDFELDFNSLPKANGIYTINNRLLFVCNVERYGCIIVEINWKQFRNLLSSASIPADMEYVIFDNKQRVFAATDEVIANTLSDIGTVKNQNKLTVSDVKYYTAYADANSVGYSFLLLNPVELLESNLQITGAILIFAILTAVAVSILIIFFNQKVYAPLGRIIKMIGGESQSKSEFEIISKKFDELISKDKARSSLDEISLDMTTDLSLHYVFYNSAENSADVVSSLGDIYVHHYIMVVACQDINGNAKRGLCERLQKLFPNIQNTDCGKYTTAFIVPTEAELKSCVSEIQKSNETGTKTFVGISDSIKNSYTIKEAFTDAIKRLSYSKVELDKSITVVAEDILCSQPHLIKLELQQEIVNCTVNGSFAFIKDIVDEYLKEHDRLFEIKATFALLSSLADYVINTMKIGSKFEMPRKINFQEELNPQYMYDCLFENFYALCNFCKEIRHSSLKSRLVEYINEKYAKQLTLDIIADDFGISTVYLSAYFKKETGTNISTYIAGLRINKAKQLLIENEDAKISEIAEQVGIYSQATFIRQFRKSTDMTPNEYRSKYLNTSESNKGHYDE